MTVNKAPESGALRPISIHGQSWARPAEPAANDRFPGVVAGGAMVEVLEQLAALADDRRPVLLLGETGTGKSFLGRALHDATRPAPGPFFRIDCAGAAFEAVAAEVARAPCQAPARPGLHGGGGTLFLDTADALLAEGGERLPWLCAGRRLVVAAQREGVRGAPAGFVLVRLPALRERRSDIADLCHHLLGTRRHGNRTLSPGALAALIAFDWPGNVRQLANELARASLIADGGVIGRRHLSDKLSRRASGAGAVGHPCTRARGIADAHVGPDRRAVELA